jgi:hypothetical protein
MNAKSGHHAMSLGSVARWDRGIIGSGLMDFLRLPTQLHASATCLQGEEVKQVA